MNSAETAGGGIACLDYSDPIITNNKITGNTASLGGGIYGLDSFLTIISNTITGNTASSYGGGIYGYYVGATVINNVISGNMAGNKGGGMAVLEATHTSYPIWEIWNNIIANNSAGNAGGGISIQCSFPDGHNITNNTITGNSAGTGGAIALYLSAYPVITNSILWANSAPEIYISEGGGDATVNYSDITGGWPGVGNIDVEPLFITYHRFEYLLRRGSPCIDFGDPALEDGFIWPEWYNNGSRSDMGAYGGPGNVGWLR
jgi:parallel beta-helix repeat protein